MTAPEAPAPPVSRTAEVWLEACDDLLAAANHALSNRVAALLSLAKILEYSRSGNDSLLEVLGREVGELERTIGLLRLLPRNAQAAPEPLRLGDLLPDVLALHRLQGELRELDYAIEQPTDLPPICVDPPTLAHTLLLLLGAAARVARRTGGSGVKIASDGDGEWVRLTIAAVEGAAMTESAEATARPLDMEAVAAMLDRVGGELTLARMAGHPPRSALFEVRLPTLEAVRQREC